MSRILVSCSLFLTLIYTYALASVPEDAKQKRGIIGNDGWIGLPGPYGYGHGHPWSVDHTPWKGLKWRTLHAGLHSADALSTCSDSIALTPGILRAPVYITKHVVLEKPVPIPEPVIIEKPYHVPVPIEKIIHKPVPIPVPVPQYFTICLSYNYYAHTRRAIFCIISNRYILLTLFITYNSSAFIFYFYIQNRRSEIL
ncbi:hypothetical protein ACFW04_002183 [Cataglyphis niger]